MSDIILSMGARVRKSPFFDAAMAAGMSHASVYNRMVIPLSYGNAAAEYRRLIEGVSVWDVGVERQVEISGPDAFQLAQALSCRDLANCAVGQGKYAPICDHAGRLINDPIALRVEEDRFWFSIADSDLLLWARAVAGERGLDVTVCEPDVSPLAVQGPKAEDVVAGLFGDWVREIRYFHFRPANLDGIPLLLARSGWSKQGGFELYLQDGSQGAALWNRLMEAGRPFGIGPGAPNVVERVESALLSHNTDTAGDANPFEVRLGKFVNLDRADDFIGKAALTRIRDEGPRRRLIGLFLDGPPVTPSRHPWPVSYKGSFVGTASVAVYSPRLARNIALALLTVASLESAAGEGGGDGKGDAAFQVASETGPRSGTVTDLPFC